MLYQIIINETSYYYEESFKEAEKTVEVLRKSGYTVEVKCLAPKKGER